MKVQELRMLQAVEVGPSGDTRGVVIWLHGLGADGHDFVSVVPMLGLPDVRFVFPHAPIRPVTVNAGYEMRAWYDIRMLERGPDREDLDHVRDMQHAIEALIDREQARGVEASRIVLAGFSQGGAMALHVAHRFGATLAGLMALSTYIVDDDTWDEQAHPANAQTPALCCHGTHDEVVPYAAGRQAFERLVDRSRDVRWETFPMGHAVCDAQLEVIGAWLRSRFHD
jgi:phospholipase/carboxylesterase